MMTRHNLSSIKYFAIPYEEDTVIFVDIGTDCMEVVVRVDNVISVLLVARDVRDVEDMISVVSVIVLVSDKENDGVVIDSRTRDDIGLGKPVE